MTDIRFIVNVVLIITAFVILLICIFSGPVSRKWKEHKKQSLHKQFLEAATRKINREDFDVTLVDFKTEKTLNNVDKSSLAESVSDVEIYGDPCQWRCLCKASSKSEGWMKSTKVLELSSGSLVRVTTQQRNPDGSWSLAEALAYVPGEFNPRSDNGNS